MASTEHSMGELGQQQELYHEIFGSILDRREMTPYLLRHCDGYQSALRRAASMMANRGFDVVDGELGIREQERAYAYVRQAREYLRGWLFPFVERQFHALAGLGSPLKGRYEACIASVHELQRVLEERELYDLVAEDPRHLFLLSSSTKYPHLFNGYKGLSLAVPPQWRMMACAILKMCHLIKAIEEDSQDINDYARLGLFLESKGISLSNLFDFRWDDPDHIPDDESSRRAFVKLSVFFRKLRSSILMDETKQCRVFDSGDGVRVDLQDVMARLKSPESMFTKLGHEAEEEANSIRDILAITFLLRDREEALTLFHALQKRGVILQENTVSTSITQTLFEDSADMEEAVRRLMVNLARSEGSDQAPQGQEVVANASQFFRALSVNACRNPHSSDRHRKFQCKINFSLPIHRDAATRRILIPGTVGYKNREGMDIITQQHTLPVEIRISDCRSWEESEERGEAHHDAYKTRQLLSLMNRLFEPAFAFPSADLPRLREDQGRLYS